jgi:hypothetical protein
VDRVWQKATTSGERARDTVSDTEKSRPKEWKRSQKSLIKEEIS